jgi:hypothetical protein
LTFWVRVVNPDGLWKRIAKKIDFWDKAAFKMNQIFVYNLVAPVYSFWDNFLACNPYGGSPPAPVSQKAAVQVAQSKFRQTVNGAIDFNFQEQFGSYSFSQTSNFRLKGGDSSKVHLLDIRKAYNTFEVWKGTIMVNPAPVNFILKKISHIFEDIEVNGVNHRDETSYAIDEFLKTQDATILVERNPDVAANATLGG